MILGVIYFDERDVKKVKSINKQGMYKIHIKTTEIKQQSKGLKNCLILNVCMMLLTAFFIFLSKKSYRLKIVFM